MTDRPGSYWTRKRLSRRTALSTGGAAMAGLAGAALVGCGDDDDDSGDGNGDANATAAPTKAPVRGGKLRWGSNGDINPATMPTYQSVTSSFPLQYGVTDYLTKYEGFALDKIKGHMAEKWEQQSDLEMTLTLRPGIKWHTGEPLIASDIVFNFEKIIGSRSAVEALSRRVKPVAVNDTTVKLTFSEPLPSVFDLFNYMYLNQPKNFDKLATGEAIIGTGPFMFKTWVPNQKTNLVRNPDYWQQGKPYLDEIEYHILPLPNLATTMEAGGLDYSASLVLSEAQRIGKNDDFSLVPGSKGFAFQYVNSNTEHPALVDKRIRQAINWAIDRKRIAEEVFGGLSPEMVLVYPEYSPGYDGNLAKSYSYDPNKAKQLLSSAGYNSGSATEVPLSFSSASSASEGVMTILQNDLQKIGFKSRLDRLEPAVNAQKAAALSYEGLFTGLLGYAGMYPTTFMLGRVNPPNYMHYDPPGYKDFLTKCFKEGNVQSTQKQAMDSFNKFMLDESMMVPTAAFVFPHLMTSKLQGFNINVVDDIRLEELWLDS